MNRRLFGLVIPVILAVPAFCQDRDTKDGVPIFRVTVVERSMKAINYAYRTGPTMIDFSGTVLLPKAKGEAVVESKQGRTEIDARFENFSAPQGFGREYMTYVLWAITPEGRARNLGEVVPGSSNKASSARHYGPESVWLDRDGRTVFRGPPAQRRGRRRKSRARRHHRQDRRSQCEI